MLRKAADDAMDSSHIVDLPPPWERECAMTRELYHDGGPNGKSKFHLIDIWHSIHLGIGKAYVCSQCSAAAAKVDPRVHGRQKDSCHSGWLQTILQAA